MRHFIYSSILFLLFTIESCMAENAVYVSSVYGDDRNPGTEIAPLKTIGCAIKRGNKIYLKAGETFFEYVELQNKSMTRYGEGPNPLICGFKRPIKPMWENVSENIWRINLSLDSYSGFSNPQGSSFSNNIGCIYEYDKDRLHARNVKYKSMLRKDWDIWQSDSFTKQSDPSIFDYLYLYYSGDPNKLNVEFSVGYRYGIKLINSSVNAVNVKGFGEGGVTLYGKCEVRNCRIDVIGGSIMQTTAYYVCLGNGIDFWLSHDAYDCVIEDNYITRCYDCGCTLQGSGTNAHPKNVVFRKNLIGYCCQGWEDFLRNGPNNVFENCRFEDNIVVHAGTSDFGYDDSRFKYCNILGNNIDGNRGMIIRNNQFYGGNYYCSGAYDKQYKSNVWKGNVCYIERESYLLSNYDGSADVIRIPTERSDTNSLNAVTKANIRKYRELTGDSTTRFVIKRQSRIDSLANKAVRRFLKEHEY